MDIATLTGACIIALGGEVAGMFTPSDAMAAGLCAASNAAGEKLWRMPMEASYAEQLKSSVADMKNTGEAALHFSCQLVMVIMFGNRIKMIIRMVNAELRTFEQCSVSVYRSWMPCS